MGDNNQDENTTTELQSFFIKTSRILIQIKSQIHFHDNHLLLQKTTLMNISNI